MASLEGVLSRIPGLAGYLAQKQYDEEQSASQLHQAGGLLGLKNAIDAQNESQTVRGILASSPDLETAIPQLSKAGLTGITAATHLQALDKARKDAEFTKQLGDFSALTPQQLDMLGGKLAIGSHPGASTVMNIADKRRTQMAADAALASMKTQGPVGDAGPQIPQAGIVPPYLLKSSYVGDSAQALMDRVNAGAPGLTAASVEKNIEQLGTAHNAARQAEALVGARGAEARKTKETAPGVNPEGILDPEARKQAAVRYRIDGTLPANLGRGNQGATNTALILKDAAAMAKEDGQTPEEARINQIANRASSIALPQLVKQKNLVLAFEKNALRNADLVLQESEKTDRIGSPAIDRWLLAGKKNIAGDAKVARLDAAMRTFVNEYARVTTSVTGGGITSDTARREIETLLASKNTKEQVREVVDLMKTEMDNRRIGYEQQEKELRGTISASGTPKTSPSAGYIEIRKTTSGKRLGKKADGTIEEIK